jgi:hypothetical protein
MWNIAVLLYLFLSPVMAAVVMGFSAVVLTTGRYFPAAFLAIHTGLHVFGSWVGIALTWILMVPFFYLAFFPARLILLLKGSDPLTRAFPSSEETMWVKHATRESLDRYERQF